MWKIKEILKWDGNELQPQRKNDEEEEAAKKIEKHGDGNLNSNNFPKSTRLLDAKWLT